jgi:hypothetical protein
MDGNGDGFEHRCVREGEILRQAIENALRYGYIFSKCAGTAIVTTGDAHYLAVVAKVDLTTPAELADTAVDSGVEGDAVAGTITGDAFTHGRNHAGSLVAHHDRRNAPPRAAVIAMDVAAAYSAGRDADKDLAGTGNGSRQLCDGQMFIFGEQQGLHARLQVTAESPWLLARGSVAGARWQVRAKLMR